MINLIVLATLAVICLGTTCYSLGYSKCDDEWRRVKQ
jgi:hypothetical protein